MKSSISPLAKTIATVLIAGGISFFSGTVLGQEAGDAEPGALRVSVLVEGAVVQVNAEPGQAVKKGDLLVKIDDAEFRLGVQDASARIDSSEAEVMIAEASLEMAKHSFDRVKELADAVDIGDLDLKKAEFVVRSAEGEFRKARAALVAAEAGRELREIQLSRTHIISPIDGVVKSVAAKPGEFVTKGQVLVEIVPPDEGQQ